jgi:LuxR family maltose regulon positive regulatory protein
MVTTILATKLYIPPPRAKIVLRPHLIERLNEGLSSGRTPGVTLISASAGFGKTTLVSEWVASCGQPVAWLSLDNGDSSLSRFLTCIIAALQTVQPALGETLLAALQAPQQPPVETLLTSLLNEISALPDDLILVLDDYHLLDSKSVDAALTFLVEHQPPQLRLFIVSREDPPLPLARLRVRNQLTELRTADLRFTPAEATDFLNRTMGLNLSESDVAGLEKRTEGWIAGLQLAALSMQGQKDTAGFIQSFTGSNRFVLDYLLEEVLQRQPEHIQTFLLRTSILNRLCAPLCEAILDNAAISAQETLENLERANLFIVPLDQERRWYRYHHLFGDLLRQRLGAPAELSELHLRASRWYETNGDLSEAFHHAISAADFERAARLAEAAWPGAEESFQSAAWLGWVNQLPEAVIRAKPELCSQAGRAYSDAGDPKTSEIHLQNAERALAKEPDQDGFAILRGNIALTHRAQAVITLEITHWASGALESSLYAIRAWMADMHKVGNPVFVIASAFAEADLLVVLGRLHEAIRAYEQALQLAAEHGTEAQQITAHHHLGLALIYHELGDSESTAAHLQTAADIGQRTTLVDWLHRWKLAQARFKESAGEWDAALELLDEAKQVYVKTLIPISRPVETLKARIHLKQGRLDEAREWAKGWKNSIPQEVSYLAEFDLLTLVRVRLAEGSFTGVNDLLDCLRILAETQNRMGSVLEILITEALVHQAQGHASQAFATLDRALTLAKPEGYFRMFLDEGEAMRLLISDFLLTIASRAHPLFEYVDKLLSTFPQPAEAIPQSKTLAPHASAGVANQKSDNFESLSDRELKLASGFTWRSARSRDTTCGFSTNFRFRTAQKPSFAPANWACSDLPKQYSNSILKSLPDNTTLSVYFRS